jgi:hypothetical protein
MKNSDLSEQFLTLLKRISEKKIYGSVEIYFEEGKVTQITQRIIKKIHSKKDSSPISHRNDESLADLMV